VVFRRALQKRRDPVKKFLCAAALLFSLAAAPAQAADYVVDYKSSKIAFSGTHAGNAFNGTFGTWTALIRFDPADLAGSQITATFDTSTAKTGNSMYDGTLPQADWFDVKNHPQATFTSTAITGKEDGSGYTARGDLTLRGITKPVSFDFTIGDLAQTPVTAKASFAIDRLDFDIGKKSDAPAEWVSREIVLTFDISATPREE
jgi:polyisoprenoid-binding protein YceI